MTTVNMGCCWCMGNKPSDLHGFCPQCFYNKIGQYRPILPALAEQGSKAFGSDLLAQNMTVLLREAHDLAARAHANQFRKGVVAEPYISHVASVAVAVHRITEGDKTSSLVAYLHDALEQSPFSEWKGLLEEIRSRFGDEVAHLTFALTDPPNLRRREDRKSWQIWVAPYQTVPVAVTKIVDKTFNLESSRINPPPCWEQEDFQAYRDSAVRFVNAAGTTNHPWLKSARREFHRELLRHDRAFNIHSSIRLSTRPTARPSKRQGE